MGLPTFRGAGGVPLTFVTQAQGVSCARLLRGSRRGARRTARVDTWSSGHRGVLLRVGCERSLEGSQRWPRLRQQDTLTTSYTTMPDSTEARHEEDSERGGAGCRRERTAPESEGLRRVGPLSAEGLRVERAPLGAGATNPGGPQVREGTPGGGFSERFPVTSQGPGPFEMPSETPRLRLRHFACACRYA